MTTDATLATNVTAYLLDASAYHMALILDSIAAELEGRGVLAQGSVRNAASLLHAEIRARGDVKRAVPAPALDLVGGVDAVVHEYLDPPPAEPAGPSTEERQAAEEYARAKAAGEVQ